MMKEIVGIIKAVFSPQREEKTMDLISLLNGLIANIEALKLQIDELNQKLVDAQGAVDEQVKISYDKGFADGVASVPTGGDGEKIYTQADLDAAVAAATGALQVQIDTLNVQIVELQGSIEVKIQEAILAFKADLLAKFEAQQAVENESEAVFKQFLV